MDDLPPDRSRGSALAEHPRVLSGTIREESPVRRVEVLIGAGKQMSWTIAEPTIWCEDSKKGIAILHTDI